MPDEQHRNAVPWARAAERALPDHTEFCFSVTEVARPLKLRPRARAAAEQSRDGRRVDIDALRTALGLTQAQLAVAIGVSERTVQNWEAGRVSPNDDGISGPPSDPAVSTSVVTRPGDIHGRPSCV